jgi:hypothetical protein
MREVQVASRMPPHVLRRLLSEGTGPFERASVGDGGCPATIGDQAGAGVTTPTEFDGLNALTLCHAPATVTFPSERPPKALRQLKETRRHRSEQSFSTPGTNTGWTGVCPVAP